MCLSSEFVIDNSDIEIKLPGVLGLELSSLQLDDEITELLDVEEQEVYIEVVPSYLDVDLLADESETWP